VVSAGNGIFEVTVDSKKVKTPVGSVLTVENEALALAVAHEWQSQEDVIQVELKYQLWAKCMRLNHLNQFIYYFNHS
jgi:hypothetical protein